MEDTNISTVQNDNDILSVVKWWEKKRLLFNLLVGLSGIIGMIIFHDLFYLIFLAIPIFWYVIIVNICYSFGWGVYVLKRHYYKDTKSNISDRQKLFYGGLVLSIYITIYGTYLLNTSLIFD